MKIDSQGKLQKMLLDPIRSEMSETLLKDTIEDDQNLGKAAKTAHDLFKKVISYQEKTSIDRFVEKNFDDNHVKDLFRKDIGLYARKGTVGVIQQNLKELIHQAKGKRYGGFFGFFRHVLNLLGLYNPKDIQVLKDLSERKINIK